MIIKYDVLNNEVVERIQEGHFNSGSENYDKIQVILENKPIQCYPTMSFRKPNGREIPAITGQTPNGIGGGYVWYLSTLQSTLSVLDVVGDLAFTCYLNYTNDEGKVVKRQVIFTDHNKVDAAVNWNTGNVTTSIFDEEDASEKVVQFIDLVDQVNAALGDANDSIEAFYNEYEDNKTIYLTNSLLDANKFLSQYINEAYRVVITASGVPYRYAGKVGNTYVFTNVSAYGDDINIRYIYISDTARQMTPREAIVSTIDLNDESVGGLASTGAVAKAINQAIATLNTSITNELTEIKKYENMSMTAPTLTRLADGNNAVVDKKWVADRITDAMKEHLTSARFVANGNGSYTLVQTKQDGTTVEATFTLPAFKILNNVTFNQDTFKLFLDFDNGNDVEIDLSGLNDVYNADNEGHDIVVTILNGKVSADLNTEMKKVFVDAKTLNTNMQDLYDRTNTLYDNLTDLANDNYQLGGYKLTQEEDGTFTLDIQAI